MSLSFHSQCLKQAFLAAATVLVCAACGGGSSYGPTAPAGGATTPTSPTSSAVVAMSSADDGYGSSSNVFLPGDVSILRDGTVSWNNGSGRTHNVTFATAAGAPTNIVGFGSGSQDRTFAAQGNFTYTCTLHAGMSGVVRVQ